MLIECRVDEIIMVFMYPFLKVSETKTIIIRYIDAFVHLFSYLYLVSTNNLLIKTTVGSLK